MGEEEEEEKKISALARAREADPRSSSSTRGEMAFRLNGGGGSVGVITSSEYKGGKGKKKGTRPAARVILCC